MDQKEKTQRSFFNTYQSTPQPVIDQPRQGYSITQPSLSVQHVQHFHESIPQQWIPHSLTGYSNDKSNDDILILEDCQLQMEQSTSVSQNKHTYPSDQLTYNSEHAMPERLLSMKELENEIEKSRVLKMQSTGKVIENQMNTLQDQMSRLNVLSKGISSYNNV